MQNMFNELVIVQIANLLLHLFVNIFKNYIFSGE